MDAQQKTYLNELMAVHDQRIKYLDQLNGLVRTPTTKGSILGMKAHDMIVFSGKNLDVNSAYSIEKEAVDLEKENADYFMFQDMMDLSLRKLKADTNTKKISFRIIWLFQVTLMLHIKQLNQKRLKSF